MRAQVVRGILAAFVLGVAVAPAAAQAPMTADAALAKLKAGNARFASGHLDAAALDQARRSELAAGQHPFASILSCSDSRVPPEHVFNVGLGDLFTIRVAGEVADRAVIGSIEYAVEHLHTPVVLVMGHAMCGAVKATLESKGQSLGPNLDYMLSEIKPAVDRVADSPDDMKLKRAVLANVEQSINDLVQRSAILREHLAKGDLMIVGGYYDLASGQVLFSQPVTATPQGTK